MRIQNTKLKFQRFLILSSVFCFLSSFVYAQEPELKPAETEETVVVSEIVTLDFKDADIKNVLNIISYKSGVNIVATPEVRGTVTIRLQDVHWEKALDTIIRTYGFGYEWLSDKVIMVSTLERLAEQRRTQEEAAVKEPVDTEAFILNFAKAEEIKTAIEKLVSERGKITLEIRTNTLIITDTKSNLIKIGRVIKELDRATPQVLIEAKIVETNLTDTKNLGIKWTIGGTVKGPARPTTFPFTSHSDSKYLPDDFLGPTKKPDETGSLFKLGTLDASSTTAILEMLFQDGETDLLSNPRIVTLDNQEATIEVVTLDPTPQWSYNKEQNTYVMTDYRQEKYGIILKVTPQINKLGYVTLTIQPEVSEWLRDKTLSGGTGGISVDLPVIYKQTTKTTVMIKDGSTLVIGGLIKNKTVEAVQKIPLLGDIPLLGYFFKHKAKSVEKKDLLIFLRPKILNIQETQ
jgi:type IV pilus assembly protein PilQ